MFLSDTGSTIFSQQANWKTKIQQYKSHIKNKMKNNNALSMMAEDGVISSISEAFTSEAFPSSECSPF